MSETRSAHRIWIVSALTLSCLAIGAAAVLGAVWFVPRISAAQAAGRKPVAPSIGVLMASATPGMRTGSLEPIASDDSTAVASTDPAAGTEGAAGLDGAAGVDGAEGPEGPEGAVGADGSVGATGPAGVGLSMLEEPTQGVAIVSPDGTSYRIVVRDDGIFLQGPTTTQFWSDSSHLQTATP